MKKIIFPVLIGSVLLSYSFAAVAVSTASQPSAVFPESFPSSPLPWWKRCWEGSPVVMGRGQQGEEVRRLQSLLSQDKTIYPQGLVTGYFGPLTEAAVKRLQKKYGLSETGVVDKTTIPIIYPCFEIQIIYPNGGESFRVGETMKISWQLSLPIYELQRQTSEPKRESEGEWRTEERTQGRPEIIPPLPPVLSVDLIEEVTAPCQEQPYSLRRCLQEKKEVFHIRDVSLADKNVSSTIEWLIPQSIPESNNYKIRVSSGLRSMKVCPTGKPCVQGFPSSWWRVYDESDGTFSILGGLSPTVSATPTPTLTPQPKLEEIRQQLIELIQKLQRLLEQLDSLIGR